MNVRIEINESEVNLTLFKRYNPAEEVIRCPRGRAEVRKQLNAYAKAAMQLYGVIHCKDLVIIFNKQNSDQTTVEEMRILLLPIILKKGDYCFYKDYLVHWSFIEELKTVENLLNMQAGKPRYIPNKEEFLNYSNEYYSYQCLAKNYLFHIRSEMYNLFSITKSVIDTIDEIIHYIMYSNDINNLNSLLQLANKHSISDFNMHNLLEEIMEAKNNVRIWENNGHTPIELFEFNKNRAKQAARTQPNVIHIKEAGRNEPCPCGSGMKYKKCCAVVNDGMSARLSVEDCQLFYETWHGLLGFVNKKKNLIDANIKPEYPNKVSDHLLHQVRDVLWGNVNLIDEYCAQVDLSAEKIALLKSWKNHHIKDRFILLEYKFDYAVFVHMSEKCEYTRYGVKGISNSINRIMQRELPIFLETVLLPFKGKIIHDSFIATMQITFGDGMKEAMRSVDGQTVTQDIITSLE